MEGLQDITIPWRFSLNLQFHKVGQKFASSLSQRLRPSTGAFAFILWSNFNFLSQICVECRILTLTDLKKSKGLHHETQGTAVALEGLKNADKLQNPGGLEPVPLPLKLASLIKVPVVVSAGSEAPGKPLHLITSLYVTVDNTPDPTSIHRQPRRSAAPSNHTNVGSTLLQDGSGTG